MERRFGRSPAEPIKRRSYPSATSATRLGWAAALSSRPSSTTWVMHLNDAAHYTISQCEANNILIQLRLAAPVATPMILPQFVFGGGWYSALYFTNTGTTSGSFLVNFVADTGTALFVPSLGGSSTLVNLAPHATAVIEAPNNGPLSEGYASFSLPSGVMGYGAFRQSVPGIADQEAVVPFYTASSATARLTWDDTTYETGVAIVNPGSVSSSISVTAWDSLGSSFAGTTFTIAARSKLTAALRDLLPVGTIAGKERYGSLYGARGEHRGAGAALQRCGIFIDSSSESVGKSATTTPYSRRTAPPLNLPSREFIPPQLLTRQERARGGREFSGYECRLHRKLRFQRQPS